MHSIPKVKIAVVGCGAISKIYFENMTSKFSILEIVGCCDLNFQAAEVFAKKYNIKNMTIEEILADKSIELVVNLTTPGAHYSVIKTLLEGGKHVYTEKVLTVKINEAKELVQLADAKNLQLCAAPDTFLGSGLQTARLAVESGLIGEITSCCAILNRDARVQAERLAFTIKPGGGIGMDVGIYYATALLSILGPVTAVCGMSKTHEPHRKHYFTSHDNFGEDYTMECETLLAGTLQFENGIVGSVHFNSSSIHREQPQVILYGTEGIMFLPDPNTFGGEVKVLAKGQPVPYVLPATHAYSGNCRGLGVAEMAWAIRKNRTPRTCKEMAYHALELLTGIVESSETKQFYTMHSTFTKTPPLPRGYMDETYGQSEPEAALALE